MLMFVKRPGTVAISVASLCFALSAAAVSSTAVFAQTAAGLAQSYETSGSSTGLVAGSLVSATPSKKGIVELASLKNTEQLVGVVANEPLVTIVDNNNTVSVVTNGNAMVLVSDINGQPKPGDKVTASPIAGIGMKASQNGKIVGTIQAGTAGASASTTRAVKDTEGTSHDIKISTLPIQLSVGYYQVPGSNFIPPFVQRSADSIAGEPVSVVRIIVVSLILLAGLCSIIALMYASGRNSIAAIGRNPLSANLVYKGMYRVGILAIIILVFSTLTSFVLLKL